MGLTLDVSWMLHGLCREVGGDLFYPEKADYMSARAAKSVCARCPVESRCLGFALATREPQGVWGGKSPEERRRILARVKNGEAA